MPSLLTTVVGSMPKADYFKIPDWFWCLDEGCYKPQAYTKFINNMTTQEFDQLAERAVKDAVREQEDLSISVITDGEQTRENYIMALCRKMSGFDFFNTEDVSIRSGACRAVVPVIRDDVTMMQPGTCAEEWRRTQAFTSKPVKYTIPGPMTILNTVKNSFYATEDEASEALYKALNQEILKLAKAGCKHIQIDEPVLVRNVEVAKRRGIDHAARCFQGVGSEVEKIIHICCGYPVYLDQQNYMKADPECYPLIASQLDESIFDSVSLEDAHRHNDLSLFTQFTKTNVILGVVQICKSRVESVQEIKDRVLQVLSVVPRDRLRLAPDCGLGHLPMDILRAKLTNMVTAANDV